MFMMSSSSLRLRALSSSSKSFWPCFRRRDSELLLRLLLRLRLLLLLLALLQARLRPRLRPLLGLRLLALL